MTEQHETPSGVSGRALQPNVGPEGGGPRDHGGAREAANRTQRSNVGSEGGSPRNIPQATVARLATYLRVLAALSDEGVAIVSSEELAGAAGVNSAKLRKDLSFLGPNGVRGVGYDVARLRARIEDVLGLSEGHRVVLVGAGNLGRALVGYRGFRRRGFTVVGLFDNDPSVIGQEISGLRVRDVVELAAAIESLHPTIAVIAVPDDAAQQVCDELVAAGMQSILSFAPRVLVAPPNVEIRRVDLAAEMQMLSFERVRNADPEHPTLEPDAAGADSADGKPRAAASIRDDVAKNSPSRSNNVPADSVVPERATDRGDTAAAYPLTGSGRIARRVPAHSPSGPAGHTPCAAPSGQLTSHSATEPTSKGSVCTP
ncbi:redox-sensing transcriptional repressor Rex [Nocardia paucivorans]|uniref:redox-sensing transcriptional repressor Rex n=1 Tax=Nocardia paucivorans TaxID=114259 RepID=UPI0009FFBE12